LRTAGVLAVVVSVLFYSSALGQAIGVEYDLNMPLFTEPAEPGATSFAVDKGFGLRVGYLSRNYADDTGKRRWSLFFGFLSAETEVHSPDPYSRRYNGNYFEGGHDWLVLRKSRMCFSAGFSLGLLWIKHSSNTAFGNLPRGGFYTSAFSRFEVSISKKVGLVFGIRSWLVTRGRDDMFPFKSGPVMSVGLRLN
jgi:hypothetical protein